MIGIAISRCGNCGHMDIAHDMAGPNASGNCEAHTDGMPCMCYHYEIGFNRYEFL